MLTTSLAYRDELAEPELTEEEKDREFWSLCGCWKDDPEDAARMEAAIKQHKGSDSLLFGETIGWLFHFQKSRLHVYVSTTCQADY